MTWTNCSFSLRLGFIACEMRRLGWTISRLLRISQLSIFSPTVQWKREVYLYIVEIDDERETERSCSLPEDWDVSQPSVSGSQPFLPQETSGEFPKCQCLNLILEQLVQKSLGVGSVPVPEKVSLGDSKQRELDVIGLD